MRRLAAWPCKMTATWCCTMPTTSLCGKHCHPKSEGSKQTQSYSGADHSTLPLSMWASWWLLAQLQGWRAALQLQLVAALLQLVASQNVCWAAYGDLILFWEGFVAESQEASM